MRISDWSSDVCSSDLRTLQASQAHVLKQIDDAAQPIITAIMREKGANIALARGATIQAANSLDITAEVVKRLNAAKPSVSTTPPAQPAQARSEEHTSELQSLMRISYAVFCLKTKN